jgi:hypothetical protein
MCIYIYIYIYIYSYVPSDIIIILLFTRKNTDLSLKLKSIMCPATAELPPIHFMTLASVSLPKYWLTEKAGSKSESQSNLPVAT